jgi:hypothetical protein
MASRPFRVRMSEALAEAFEKDMKKAGYGPRKKGVWVGEALQQSSNWNGMIRSCSVVEWGMNLMHLEAAVLA